ncbi:MAG TPA: putative lipid II flippase FtsW [Patescibacteria group bacterium]|nr:putative lipid II flippase FtsW [Patescibacteria group bacterium]
MKKTKTSPSRPDLLLLALVLGLLVFGMVMVYDASVVSATRDFGDKYYFVKDQIQWALVGLVGLFVAMKLDYHFYRRVAVPIFFLALLLLVLVFIPGIGINAYGANRWIDFKFFIVQPAEVMKLALAIFLAAWFEEKGDIKSFKRGFLPVAVVLGVIGFLIISQPDLGSLLIIASTLLMVYFAAGARLLYYLVGLPLALGAGLLVILSSAYRKARLMTFFDPTTDTQGTSYHINQVLLALGSGGIFGTGIGQSRGKYEYLPEVTTDSIFAVIGEELGFAGSFVLLCVYGFIIYRGFKIALSAPDRFGQLLALGIVTTLATQATLNLAAMVALVPLTGVPLPFISYGGSSLVVTLTSIGILLNISKQKT